MSETGVEYSSPTITKEEQTKLHEAIVKVDEMDRGDKDAIRFARAVSEHLVGLPAYYADIKRSPRLKEIVNNLGNWSVQMKDEAFESEKKPETQGVSVEHLPQKTTNGRLITEYKRIGKFELLANGEKTVTADITVENRNWDGHSSISKLLKENERPNSGVAVEMKTKFNTRGEIISMQVEISLKSGNNYGESKYELDEQGNWVRIALPQEETPAQMANEEEIASLEEPMFNQKRIERGLKNVSGDQVKTFVYGLLGTQEFTENGHLYEKELSYQDVQKIAQETLLTDPQKLEIDNKYKEKYKDKDYSPNKYRLLINISALSGENMIFTGDDPRDIDLWFVYDKSTGNMTRIFEEVKEDKPEGKDDWLDKLEHK